MEKQDRIEELRYELNVEKQRGAMADAGKIAEIEAEIAADAAEYERLDREYGTTRHPA